MPWMLKLWGCKVKESDVRRLGVGLRRALAQAVPVKGAQCFQKEHKLVIDIHCKCCSSKYINKFKFALE